MADPTPDRDAAEGPARASTTGAPLWVKVLGLVALILVVLVGVLILTGGGSHGPGRHTPSSGVGGLPAEGHTPW